MVIVGRQIRAARALLDMSQEELANAAGLTPQAIRKIEDGSVQPREGTISDIVRVFNGSGLEFIDNQGVRFKPKSIETFEGIDGFEAFYEYMYEYLRVNGGEVCVSATDERLFPKYRKDPEEHRKRMKALVDRGDVRYRVLAVESRFASEFIEYRQLSSQREPTPTSFYAFGDCLALISFVNDPPPYVILIKSGPFASAYRQSFDTAWSYSERPNIIGNTQ